MSSSTFPTVFNTDFAADDNKKGKQYLDAAIDMHITDKYRWSEYDDLYNSYNGISNSDKYNSFVQSYGKNSRTQFVRYKLGRSKMNLLEGEFLEIPLSPIVSTTNREAINEKYEKASKEIGMMKSKKVIEGYRANGVDLFPGVEIPDESEKSIWEIMSTKSKNEVVMQHIINNKISNLDLKSEFVQNFKDVLVVSECFGKVERDIDGKDVYRPISPKNSIRVEFDKDPFLKKSPLMGERLLQSREEILLRKDELKLTSIEINLIDQWSVQPDARDTKKYNYDDIEDVGSSVFIPVWKLEWKAVETVYTKISPAKNSDEPYRLNLSPEFYRKNKERIDREVENGKYVLEKSYREVIWEGERIGKSIYKNIRKVPYTMQSRLGGKKYKALFNYTGMLYGTLDGVRVSLERMIADLEVSYDILMFQIRREINKMKGKVLTYNRAMLPAKETYKDILTKIVEDGIVDYSSTGDGESANLAATDIPDIANSLKEIDLGLSKSFPVLLQVKFDIERTVDRLTGINDNREGIVKATTTATGINQSVEASRAITFPMFYFMNKYQNWVIMLLAEKAKLNPDYIAEGGTNLGISDQEKAFIKTSRELLRDDYGSFLSDGKKETEVRARMQSLYEPQINANELSVSTIAEAEMKDNFSEYVATLKKGEMEIKKAKEQAAQQQLEAQQADREAKIEIATEDREDKQQHDLDAIMLQGEVDKEIKLVDGRVGNVHERNKAILKAETDELNRSEPQVTKQFV